MKVDDELQSSSFLLDTGANVSLISKSLYDDIPAKRRPELTPSLFPTLAGNSSAFQEYGSAIFDIEIEGQPIKHRFRIVEMEEPGIIGIDLMDEQYMVLDVHRRRIFMRNTSIRIHDATGRPFCNKVTAAQTIDLAPGKGCVMSGHVKARHSTVEPHVYFEPATQVCLKTGASFLSGVVKSNKSIVQVGVYNITSQPIRIYKHTTLGVLQEFDKIVMWRNDEIENQEVKIKTEDERNPDYPRVTKVNANINTQIPEHLHDLYERTVKNLTEDGSVSRLNALCMQFGDIFSKHSNDFGKTNLIRHHIETGNEIPFRDRPRRIPDMQLSIIKKTVTELHEKGIIRPSTSSWSANSVLVRKKDTGAPQWRMCVDFRGLNERTKNTDPYPLPRIDDTLDSLRGARFFCTLDITQGYHQVELTEESKPKTAFCTPRLTPSHWEYNFMPFGVQGGPATFQRLMDQLLFGLDYGTAFAYLDDVIICGKTEAECFDKLEKVFARMERAGLKLKPKKCHLFDRETMFLGHVISEKGVACDPAKVQAVKEWQAPRTVKQVRGFIGTVGYYKRFVKDFAKICRPLHNLTRKNTKFKWTSECEDAFETLKQCLISAPIMAYPRDEGKYILDTDASAYAIGGVLSQVQIDEKTGREEEKVIAYASRVLQPRETRYCARRRELLAIVHFAKHFRPYIYGREVLIRTDHASLRFIKTLKDPNDQFARWIMRLEEMNYTIETRRGVLHANADGLSRLGCGGKRCICDGVSRLEAVGNVEDSYRDHGLPLYHEKNQEDEEIKSLQTELNKPMVSAAVFGKLWTQTEMRNSQLADPDIAQILEAKETLPMNRPVWNEVSHQSAALKSYWAEWDRLLVIDGLLYRKWESNTGKHTNNQLILPYAYRHQIVKTLHDSKVAGHMGFHRTCENVRARFHWHRMREYIRRWIRTCDRCQRRKPPGKSPRAPLMKYTIGCPMERIAMDIMGPVRYETKNGCKYVLVITDYFSKWVDAFPLERHTAEDIAQVLLTKWIAYWGCPMSIHTDRGRDFDSKLIHEVCDLLEIEKTRTTSYHPSGDGQVERNNATICAMLATVIDKNTDWDELLPYVMMAYRSTVHSATGESPNMIMFGKQNALPIDVMTEVNHDLRHLRSIDYVNKVEEDIRYCHQRVRETTKRAALRQKRYYDRRYHLNDFRRGDQVMKRRKAGLEKFSDRWDGPFVVLQRLSDVNYRIQKSPQHRPDIVHHDMLKLYYSRTAEENDTSWIDRIKVPSSYRRQYVRNSVRENAEESESEEPMKKIRKSMRNVPKQPSENIKKKYTKLLIDKEKRRKRPATGNSEIETVNQLDTNATLDEINQIAQSNEIGESRTDISRVNETGVGPVEESTQVTGKDTQGVSSAESVVTLRKRVKIQIPTEQTVEVINLKVPGPDKLSKDSVTKTTSRSPKRIDQRQRSVTTVPIERAERLTRKRRKLLRYSQNC